MDPFFPAHIHRTGVTAKLWEQRKRDVLAKRQSGSAGPQYAPGAELPRRSPRHSFTETIMPFSTDIELRDQYLSPFGQIRIGRLLEDLDAMAGVVASKHVEDIVGVGVVTASVDRIQLMNTLDPRRDIKMQGYVTWVGRSSMEIEVDLFRQLDDDSGHWELLLTSYFTMVARDRSGRGPPGSVPVFPLEPQTEEEKAKFVQGEKNRQRRLADKAVSLLEQPPTAEERFVIHDLFKEMNSRGPLAEQSAQDQSRSVPMAATHRESVLLFQPSDRNPHNTVFGGYLMHKGFELAFLTAYLFARSYPVFLMLNDTVFHKPVQIGWIVLLEAQVVYTKGRFVHVEVLALRTDPEVGKQEQTNVFNFTFYCPHWKDDQIKRVLPDTYKEAMHYLDGRRKHEKDLAPAEDRVYTTIAALMDKLPKGK